MTFDPITGCAHPDDLCEWECGCPCLYCARGRYDRSWRR